jgi:nitrite reductase/ring-hydroxylating ferredoxin subunit
MDIAIIDTVGTISNQLEPIPMRYRDQTPGFPKGWYGVALSEEIVPGALKSVSYLDQQLVIYRDANGDARVADAYCPHLGAHLASHDGCITGGELVCPFHKWRFDGATGKCNSIPYTNIVPPQARLTLYPSMEVAGTVLMWYHPAGGEPEYLPFDPASYDFEKPWILKGEEIRTSTAPFRDLFENLFDTAHIQQLHNSNGQPEIASIERMDYGLRVNYRKPETEEAFGIDFMRFDFSGISLAVHVVEGPGYAMMQVVHATPIDHEHFYFHDRLYVRDTGSEEMNDMIGGAFVSRVLSEIAQDFQVTNTKKHLKQPLICAGDGPIMKFRLFAQELFV